MRYKIDFHVHTENSPDALGSLKEISYFARRREVNAVVVADHNRLTIEEVREVYGVSFIPAIEVRTFAGHVVCLLPRKRFDLSMAYHNPTGQIHEAGGYVIWAHPFDLSFMRSRKSSIDADAIEVYNSSSFPFRRSSKKALMLAESLGLPKVAGSDAHIPKNVGLCYVEVEAGSLLEAVSEILKGNGMLHGQATPLTDFIRLNILRVMKKRSSLFSQA
ncbi:MAG: PHP-associated domain-containing protein [Nitrososphaeria archaeon]